MKVYTQIEYQWEGGDLVQVSEESHEYGGEVAACKGGSGKTTYDWEAANRYAAISRDQWNDYKKRFQPFEQELIDLAHNDGSEEIEMAKDYTQSSMDAQKASGELSLSRMGIGMTADQAKASDRSFGIEKMAATVSAMNDAAQHADDRRNAIMTGGMASLSQATGRSS
jgi:hypothetical protein